MCAAVQRKHLFRERHSTLTWLMLALIACPTILELADYLTKGYLVPEWMADSVVVWAGGIIIFKVLLWDSAMAGLLYGSLRKEENSR